jgi:RimJ/RimL family protein N-acetyltransferase
MASPDPSPAESAAALDAALTAAARVLTRVDEPSSRLPLRPGGWSARETLGHLIDSACTNHRRFLVARVPGVSRFDGYDQDAWVALQRHADRPWSGLVELWTAYNRHLVHVMRETPPEAGAITAVPPGGAQPVTLAFVMSDYVTHLQHHLSQIASLAGTRVPWPVGPAVEPRVAEAPPRRVYAGRRHDFQPLDAERHGPDLFAGSQGLDAEGLWTYLPYGPFADRDLMTGWLRARAASADPLFFAAVERASGRAVGMCSLMRIERDMRTIELGHIWYVPAAQGSGVNADMALTFLGACFEQWGFRRAEWKCDALNARSRAAALGLGFTFEGIFRQHMVRKGHNRDTAWFSLLDSEWPAAKAALERRLAGRA